MADVELRNVIKTYEGGVKVVKGLSLTIPDKEFVVLVGPSGCGKSTTLRMIAGLEEPTAGTIHIGNRDVTRVAPKDRDIAMVFQSYALYPHLSVRENLEFGLKMRKVPRAEIDTRVKEAATQLGIEGLLDRKPKALSGGQRQRVAMGRAIVRRPAVFLFDEPLSNLDAKLRVQMRIEIGRLHQRIQTTIVYVTHDQTEAMTLADRIVVMHAEGPPLELYDRPRNKFVAGFLGSPAMNFLPGRIEHDGDVVRACAPGMSIELCAEAAAKLRQGAARDATLGIRPEHLALEAGRGTASFTGKVDVREPMGSEAYLYVETEAGQVVVRAPAHAAAREGDTVTLYVDAADLHLFDAQAEVSLLS
jgi:multiple sugar transport system ATP-binding protein